MYIYTNDLIAMVQDKISKTLPSSVRLLNSIETGTIVFFFCVTLGRGVIGAHFGFRRHSFQTRSAIRRGTVVSPKMCCSVASFAPLRLRQQTQLADGKSNGSRR